MIELRHLASVILFLEVVVPVVDPVLLMTIVKIRLVQSMVILHGRSRLTGRCGLSGVHHRRRGGSGDAGPANQMSVDRRAALTRRDRVLRVRFQPVVTELPVLLRLHATVLEPDLDLTLGQAQGLSYFDATSSGKVAIKVEFFLELQRLETGVRLPGPLLTNAARVACKYANFWEWRRTVEDSISRL